MICLFQKCTFKEIPVVWEVCAGYTACNLRFYISFMFVLWIQDQVLKVKASEWPSKWIQCLSVLFFMLISTLHILRKKMWWAGKTEMWSTKVKDSYRIHKNSATGLFRLYFDYYCLYIFYVLYNCISWEAQSDLIRTSIWFPLNQNSAEVEGVDMCAVNRRLPCWEATAGPSQTNIASLSHRQPPTTLLSPVHGVPSLKLSRPAVSL